jgi:hypothetical protein
MPTPISAFLTPKEYPLGETIFLDIDPATQFGHMGTGEGEIERVSSRGRVHVSVFDWRNWGLDEDAIIVKVLVAAASANPLKVSAIETLAPSFWAKTPGMRAVLVHPENTGRFEPPVEMVVSAEVPLDRVIILKAAPLVGYYVKQAARRNVLAHNKHGLLSVEFYRP